MMIENILFYNLVLKSSYVRSPGLSVCLTSACWELDIVSLEAISWKHLALTCSHSTIEDDRFLQGGGIPYSDGHWCVHMMI